MNDTEKRSSGESLPALFRDDPMLMPYRQVYRERCEFVARRRQEVLGGRSSLLEVADWHQHYGMHRLEDGNWRFREWLPWATRAVLLGQFNDWTASPWFELHPLGNGDWEVDLPATLMRHGQCYQLYVEWDGGSGWRLPSAVRAVKREKQPDGHVIFNAQIWEPETPYQWKHDDFTRPRWPLIYEAHVGLAQQESRIGTFSEFTRRILPRIAADGYDCVQLMAVAEHPYYASFGYHVSNFFAVTDLFGTPDDFKELVDTAHGMGLCVIMDLVHSHAVKNELEGLGRLCGRQEQFFHSGPRGEHPAWNSYLFDYSKPQVARMLLSNCRFWLEEYHLDGFRFDGITSMLYFSHGLGKAFTSYDDYFGADVDWDSIAYLTMANEICHGLGRRVWTIAEDVSGMPGLAASQADGGVGFDFRLAMGVTDYWFKLLDRQDEFWNIGTLWHELTNHRNDEKTISYVECHDQAIVGGQTFIFRCIGRAMYDAMDLNSQNMMVSRGIALHKLARLATATTANHGYMNFMGNEFGHPEWIDLPREGNNWNYDHARRRWDLCDDPELRYSRLNVFDNAMLELINATGGFYDRDAESLWVDEERHVFAYSRADLVFVFNFHPTQSYSDYRIPVDGGEYRLLLDTDEFRFNGFGRLAANQRFFGAATAAGPRRFAVQLYLPTRTALVLKMV